MTAASNNQKLITWQSCTPGFLTAVLYFAMIVYDLYVREYDRIPKHAIFGIVSVLLMNILCQYGAYLAAYGLLAFPFLLLITGYLISETQVSERISAIQSRPYTPPLPLEMSAPYKCNKCPGYDYYL